MFLSAGYFADYNKDEELKSRERKQNQKPKVKNQDDR
jgi:spore coat protein CotF